MDDPDGDRTSGSNKTDRHNEKDTRCVRFAARSACPFVLPSGAASCLSCISERK